MEVMVPDEFKYLYVQSAERPVVKVPAPVLRQVAQPVEKVTKKTQALIDEMLGIMRRANGVGLAATQIARLSRVIVMAPQKGPIALVNPTITKAEGEQIGEEGCLSIPGLYGEVRRAAYVEVEAIDRHGRPVAFEMEDMAARVVQHEIDHLDGVLFIDKVDWATVHWSHPDKEPVRAE